MLEIYNGYPGTLDYAPDEFQICLDNLQASFYFDGDDGIRIVSKSPVSFKVDFKTDYLKYFTFYQGHNPNDSLGAHLFNYLKEFTITDDQGIKYIFGGDLNAIDFSFNWSRGLEHRLIGDAMTWHLTKIVCPWGEELSFSYQKDGCPIVVTDSFTQFYAHIITYSEGISAHEEDITHFMENGETDYEHYSYTFLKPSYLERIQCKVSLDYLDCSISPSDELTYNPNSGKIGNIPGYGSSFSLSYFIAQNDYFCRLDGIETAGVRYDFRYRDNTVIKRRLRLDNLLVTDKTTNEVFAYSFVYENPALDVQYNAKMSDHWGFYTNTYYGNIISSPIVGSDNYYNNVVNQQFDTLRAPNARFMKAQSLKAIIYPTGGRTTFVYEPHEYHKVADQFPFVIRESHGYAGGLRIKEIIDSTAGKVEKRCFEYNNSGILSGKPRYGVAGQGTTTIQYVFDYRNVLDYININIDGTQITNYRKASEHFLNQLSTTDGNHVTYSMVTERFPDGSKTNYYYSNHDSCPDEGPQLLGSSFNESSLEDNFSSKEIGRGLLLRIEMINTNGNLVYEEDMSYSGAEEEKSLNRVENICLSEEAKLYRCSLNKIYTYTPLLTQKTSKLYSDNGGLPVIEQESFTYNIYGRLIRTTRTCGGLEESHRYLWASEIPYYLWMKNKGMTGKLVEHTISRDNKIVQAELTTYKRNRSNGDYVADSVWSIIANKDTSSFIPFNGIDKDCIYGAVPNYSFERYDELSNICVSRDRSGVYTTYQWDTTKMNLTGTFVNTLTGEHSITPYIGRVVDTYDLSDNEETWFNLDLLTTQTSDITINYASPFLNEIDVWGKMDGFPFLFDIMPTPYQFVHTATFFNKPAGHHFLQASSDENEFTNGISLAPPLIDEPVGPPILPDTPLEETLAPPLKGMLSATYMGWITTEWMSESFLEDFGDGTHIGRYQFGCDFNPSKLYILDYRKKINGEWQYFRESFSLSSSNEYSIGANGDEIDDIRIYPCEALVTTYGWDTRGNLVSITDALGGRESYEYDGLNRLTRVRNNKNDIIKDYDYSFSNHGPSTGTFYNRIGSRTYTSTGISPTYFDELRFFDGIGRESQTIFRTSNIKDIVTIESYDNHGRPWRTWTPVGMAISGSTAPYDSAAVSGAAATFYADARPFTEAVYDGSPLDRVKEQYGSGAAWYSAGKAVKNAFLLNNTTADSLRVYRRNVVRNASNPLSMTVQTNGYYPASTLTVERTEDEDSGTLMTFKDFAGRMVLERRKGTGLFGGVAWLDTYYIYDACGTLACVLPPLAGTDSQSMEKYAWQYAYDGRGRCIAKKTPGAGWTKIVYDTADRVVATQDPVQAGTGQWSFSIPDKLGRECLRGTLGTGFTALWGTETTFTAERSWPQMSAGGLKGYTVSGTLATADFASADILQANYYDDYSFITANSIDAQPDTSADALYFPGTSFGEWYSKSAAGLATGSLVKVLANSQNNEYLWNVAWYDEKGRPVLTKGQTRRGGVERTRFGYTFTGNPEYKGLVHTDGMGAEMTELYTYTYDGLDRPLKTFHRMAMSGTEITPWTGTTVTLSDKTYDGAGRLLSESRNGTASLASMYGYNLRSRLISTTGPHRDSLAYTWGGRVSTMHWGVGSGNRPNKFAYTYDRAGRLTGTQYSFNNVVDATKSSTYTYDNHANLTQWMTGTAGLSFTLDGNRITDVTEIDFTPLPFGPEFPGPGVTPPVTSVFYDALGRVTGDDTADIQSVVYNKIGQPMLLTEGNSQTVLAPNYNPHTVLYIYAADGRKLGKVDTPLYNTLSPYPAESTITDYVGNLIYRRTDDGMSAILVDELPAVVLLEGGYFTPADHAYHFQVTDRQGNVRVVASATGTVEQSYDYHPYGEEFTSQAVTGPANSWRYGGKEKDAGVGTRPQYDFEARRMTAAYCRFTTMDPLGEKYYHLSPYAYCAGDPVNFVDPTGMDIYRYDRKTGSFFLYEENDDDFDQIGNFKKKGGSFELKRKKDGTAKTILDNVHKGILKDGINFQEQDNVIVVGTEKGPSINNVESFVVQMSDFVGKEIGGSYLSTDGITTTHMTIGHYKNNTLNETKSHGQIAWMKQYPSISTKGIQGYFHTHPSNGYSYSVRSNPSDYDKFIRDKNLQQNPNLFFYVLTHPEFPSQPFPEKIRY